MSSPFDNTLWQSSTKMMNMKNLDTRLEKMLDQAKTSDEMVQILKKIPSCLEKGSLEAKTVIPTMIKLVAHPNYEVKKNACDFIIDVTTNPKPVFCRSTLYSEDESTANVDDFSWLVVNVLNKDLKDPNPQVRQLAVTTICSLPALADQHAIPAIRQTLVDSHPMVRKAGVTGCGRVFQHSPAVIEDNGIIDILYNQLKDTDSTVMAFVMQTLNIILELEGGIVINDSMCKYLLKRLGQCLEEELCFTLEYLHKQYSEKHKTKISHEKRLLVMNAIDCFLESKEGYVFLASSVLFYDCIRYFPVDSKKISQDFQTKIKPQVVRFLKPNSQNNVQSFQCQLLEFLISIDKQDFHLNLLSDFCLRSKDFNALKLKKIAAISHIASEENLGRILKYFLQEFENQNDEVVKEELIIQCFKLTDSHPQFNEQFLSDMMIVLQSNSEKLMLPLLKHLRLFKVTKEPNSDRVLQMCCLFFLSCNFSRTQKVCVENFLWVLSRYPDKIPDSVCYLEQFLDENCIKIQEFKLHHFLLLCGVKIFATYPAQCQILLGEIFQICREHNSQELNLKMQIYAKILKDYQLTKAVINNIDKVDQ